jgi:hypothetical protein
LPPPSWRRGLIKKKKKSVTNLECMRVILAQGPCYVIDRNTSLISSVSRLVLYARAPKPIANSFGFNTGLTQVGWNRANEGLPVSFRRPRTVRLKHVPFESDELGYAM